MSDEDNRLKAVWREDVPPARDAGFRVALIERMETRRYQRRLAAVIAAGVLASVAWAVGAVYITSEGGFAVSATQSLGLVAVLSIAALGWGLGRTLRAL